MSASKTILITGSSSGIGQATAILFHELGWNVIATMRNPEKRKTLLHEKGLPDLVHLDVMEPSSIQSALHYALDKYQRIDVLVNNAGYAVYGPFEASTQPQILKQFDTNVFGVMEMTRAILPIFRQQHRGTLINVASMGGRLGFPLYSLYNSSKWAIEGFTEALQYELKPFQIKVRLIEPGVIKTDFYDRSMDQNITPEWKEVYAEFLEKADTNASRNGATSEVVAKIIYQAAIDNGDRLRYVVGQDARLVSIIRKLLPESLFFAIFKKFVLK